jgi:hypothetical protein
MKSLLYFIRPISFLLLITAATLCQPSPRPAEKCGGSANGIALCLSPSEERNGVILEIKNIGPTDDVLNLGIMLANGAKQYPKAITLIVIDSEGKQHYATLAEPTWIAGRVDPFIVPLPDDASLKLPLHLSKYFYFTAQHIMEEFKPDPTKHYTVQAQFVGRSVDQSTANLDAKGIAFMPFWTGTANSNNVEVGPK